MGSPTVVDGPSRSTGRVATGHPGGAVAARVLVIDNYDAFVYNLVQYLGELGAEPGRAPQRRTPWPTRWRSIPTPCCCRPARAGPEDAGDPSATSIAAFAGARPVLGVCLGHQAIGQVFGGRVVRGARADARQDVVRPPRRRGVFAGLPDPFEATRYHSLVVDREGLPAVLEITAETDDGTIMGLRHRELAGRRRAVPPRVDPHRGRPRPAAQLPRRASPSPPDGRRRVTGVSSWWSRPVGAVVAVVVVVRGGRRRLLLADRDRHRGPLRRRRARRWGSG